MGPSNVYLQVDGGQIIPGVGVSFVGLLLHKAWGQRADFSV